MVYRVDIKKMVARTKKARIAAGYKNQAGIASDMGITRDAFAKYELRSCVTSENLPAFCQLTGVRMEWLLKGEMPMMAIPQHKIIRKIISIQEDQLDNLSRLISPTVDDFCMQSSHTLHEKDAEDFEHGKPKKTS